MSDPQFSPYGSEQQWVPTLVVNDPALPSPIKFDVFSGGELTASVQKFRPSGMGPEVTYLALGVYADIKLTKAFSGVGSTANGNAVNGDYSVQAALRNDVGTTGCTVTLTPINDGGTTGWAPNRVYTGRISAVNDGGTDSSSGAVRKWEVTVVVESVTG